MALKAVGQTFVGVVLRFYHFTELLPFHFDVVSDKRSFAYPELA